MVSFLEEVIQDIKNKHSSLADIIIILPNKRAGGFLKNHLKKSATRTEFAPKICSIEELIQEISDITIVDATELLFKSYDAYLKCHGISEKEDFETYTSWATTLLNDFNEIDRYLIPPKEFFSYLSDIKKMEKWGVKEQATPLINNYLQFWNSLFEIYETLKQSLLSKGIGYQGMVYREASENIEHYIKAKGHIQHVFIGFNALNNAEQRIIQELLETGNTNIYWDSEKWFQEDESHSSSLFLREYVKNWKHFKTNTPLFISNYYNHPKHIKIIEILKNIGQAKYVGELLSAYSEEQLNYTAIVLADENLLMPMLTSLPENVKTVNITMGVPLKTFPATVFFENLFALQIHYSQTLYYKDVLTLLQHTLGISLVPNSPNIISNITKNNSTHISIEALFDSGSKSEKSILSLLFGDWKNNSKTAISNCILLLERLKEKFQENPIERVVLYQLHTIFKKMEALDQKFEHLKSIKTVLNLFNELIATTTLDFKGDAYSGLQIMGVLESRVLDFENVIITSVNEGVLPSGKSNASFITYDLKAQFRLPHFTEKDAIYTYHFYHLLHRASTVCLLYNSHSEGINAGEKSRFIHQLEIEKTPNHILEHIVVSPQVSIEKVTLETIEKTESVMERLEEISASGFSPSALTNYIRNPIEFYYQKVLQLSEVEEIEETVAANTLGTIVHNTLEKLYTPFLGKFLTVEKLKDLFPLIDDEVTFQFKKTFKEGTFNKGKNLIIFEVAKRYVQNFISFEIREVKDGNRIKILRLEEKLTTSLQFSEIPFPVNLRGMVDRMDEYNGQLRIIDYKTGSVQQNELVLMEWEELTQDYKYSKIVQVLTYTLMMQRELNGQSTEAGIISFKNMSGGFLKFATKSTVRGDKNSEITAEVLEKFTEELKKLIVEICNPKIPFTEKEII